MSEAIGIENVTFKVTDDQKAEWCLKKIKEAENDKQFWKAFYDAQYKTVEETADETIRNMEGLLAEYFESVPHKKTTTQESYKLPTGKLVLKKQEPKFERDEATVIEWLKKHEGTEFVKTQESLDWSGLKNTVCVVGDGVANEDGEIIPGIKVVPRDDIFKVEVK